jgi:hypothetical protein
MALIVGTDLVGLSFHVISKRECNLDAIHAPDLDISRSELFSFLCIFLILLFTLFTCCFSFDVNE